ncbi:hypothetical protein TNIN_15081 [Trichonephila inaurata madagascariensis]|uniref:Uncharacterized protein n=1 Tax=Trichonephila inaurata madagascariensis TaxID=2747483 RepID=A0A8X6X734_9ARAC|nr:hypothetical protein TNIN_15081 [Trichonephila inaurata madagascariensis]
MVLFQSIDTPPELLLICYFFHKNIPAVFSKETAAVVWCNSLFSVFETEPPGITDASSVYPSEDLCVYPRYFRSKRKRASWDSVCLSFNMDTTRKLYGLGSSQTIELS